MPLRGRRLATGGAFIVGSVVLAVVATVGAAPEATTEAATGTPARVSVYFSPRGGAEAAVVREIEAARSSIRVQAYSFTSAPIAAALVAAHRRGVPVVALLDKSNQTARYSSATFLQNAGIPVSIDSAHAIAHSKIILLDANTPRATVITGSFNFSRAAEERNAENLLVLKECSQIAARYLANFEQHAKHAAPYSKLNLKQEAPQ